MGDNGCVQLTTPSAFFLLLLLFGVIGTSRQQESAFQESRFKSDGVRDSHGTSGSLERDGDVCSEGGFEARTVCVHCAAAKVVSSADDCCHRRQTFDLCLSIITADNDDNDITMSNDEDDDDDGDIEGYRTGLAVHGAANDGEEDDEDEDGATEMEEGDREEDKRKSPFLGKRRSPFLGKRRSPFLGKRRSPFLGKRRSPFLGKRRSPFLGKRRSPFLGKRRSPFLGKREEDNAGHAHP